MSLTTCSSNVEQVEDAPPLALLGFAGILLISLASITVSKWLRVNAANRVRTEREAGAAAAAAAGEAPKTAIGHNAAGSVKKYQEYQIEDVRVHANPNDAWVVIGDGVYDVTKWAPYHPGGERNIVDIAGRDVTDVFEAFHRDPRQRAKLEAFRIGTLVGYTPSQLVKDFRSLKRELEDQGLFEVDNSFFVKRYITLLPILALAAYLIVCFRGCTGIQLCGAGLVGFYWQQLAFLGHDAGHRSHIAERGSDDFAAYCLILPLLGIGPEWWMDSHNIHHVVCNDVQCDPDIQHLPFMAISPKFFKSLYSVYHDRIMYYDLLGRCLVSVQHLLFYPIMCVSRVFLYVQSIMFVLTKKRAKKRLHELVAYGVFFCWNIYLCCHLQATLALAVTKVNGVGLLAPGIDDLWTLLGGPVAGAWARAGYVLISHAVSGILHVQITLSHFSMDVTEKPQYCDDTESWVPTQLNTTLDVDCFPWMDWFHGGLQFQALHHLFPKLPRYNLRSVQSRVRSLAEKHGLAYHCIPFWQANVKTFYAMEETAKQAWSTPSFRFKDSMLYEGMTLVG